MQRIFERKKLAGTAKTGKKLAEKREVPNTKRKEGKTMKDEKSLKYKERRFYE